MKTNVTWDKLVHALESGMSIASACKVAGISKPTYYEWTKKPEKAARLKACAANREQALIDKIATAASVPSHWTAAAWLLERCPGTAERWRKKEETKVVMEYKNVPLEQLKADAEALAKRILEMSK
jgi:transposase